MRRIVLGKGRSMQFEEGDMPIYESLEAWKAEGEKRFGTDVLKWRFTCPMCGHVAAVEDFKAAGAEDPANCAYEECLGRYTGKGSPKKGDSSGCNWAAYGLFGIPKGGALVITGKEEDGTEKGAHIFDFAEGNVKQ